jgi:hypothetical protein
VLSSMQEPLVVWSRPRICKLARGIAA